MAKLSLNKLKMPKLTMENLLIAGAVVALVYALNNYAGNKQMNVEGATGGDHPAKQSAAAAGPGGVLSGAGAESYAQVNGLAGSEGSVPAVSQQSGCNPADLLPKDNNSEWSKINPSPELNNPGLLDAGHHIGINTVGQSLRNANLQLRSEPANPQQQAGPWNQSTIAPDNMRRPLEIGA